MQAVLRYIPHILPVNDDSAARDVIKPEQKSADRRFTRPGRTYDGNGLTGGYVDVDALEYRPLGII